MPRRIAIHAGHVIAFDGHGHRLLRDGTVIVDGDRIVSVGPREAAAAGADVEAIEARDAILTPGLISTHAHIGGSPLDRSFIEDRGNPQFFYSGLFELLPVRGAAQDEEATRACVDFSMAELLRGGVTTVMEIGGASEYVVARAADFGLRVYVGLAFRSGRWLTRDGRRVEWEWDEEQGRHGKTPVAWLRDLGVLGPSAILGHAIVVGGSSWTNYPAGDVAIMAEAGCSVAHAVWVFARRGVVMESFAGYRRAGVNMSLGTDTNPQSVIEAMRWAAVVSKIVERNTEATTAAHVFDAATLGGARALGRDDLGRIAPGARADLVLWKGASWGMTPLRDPVKNIVYNATAEDVDRVWVNGRLVVDGGGGRGADQSALFAALPAGGGGTWAPGGPVGPGGPPPGAPPPPTGPPPEDGAGKGPTPSFGAPAPPPP